MPADWPVRRNCVRCAPDAAQRHKRVYARLRRAMALAERCAAEPGPLRTPVLGTVPALRSGMKDAAPRPGHESPRFRTRRRLRACLKDAPFASLLAAARAFRHGEALRYSAGRQVTRGQRIGETQRCLPLTPP